jgi:two-component system NtrC family response regulator
MGSANRLLIVEDDPALQKQMRWAFDKFETYAADNREDALDLLRRYQPPVVTMDLGLPPHPDSTEEGFALLEQMLQAAPATKVIVLTGQNDHVNALKAVELGAYDFFSKPFEPELLTLTIDRAFRLWDLQQENKRLQSMVTPDALGAFITRDPEMLRVLKTVEKIASSNATVLLLGESGTGKEILARGVHEASSRRGERFVAINCAAIPDNLLESELFGYEKGAFTGASKTTVGKIETANGGTLFLDEIGDLPFTLQAKLLRFLQERVIERIGGRQEIPVNVRIVCATHRDLSDMISTERFREDLYYRLAELTINIPPLRARIGDPILLANAFVKRFALENNLGSHALSNEAIKAIEAHPWPGNVRELENCIKRAVIMADGRYISNEDLGFNGKAESALEETLDLRLIREEAEKRAVITALGRANDNVLKAAEILNVSRPTLYDLMHRFGLR